MAAQGGGSSSSRRSCRSSNAVHAEGSPVGWTVRLSPGLVGDLDQRAFSRAGASFRPRLRPAKRYIQTPSIGIKIINISISIMDDSRPQARAGAIGHGSSVASRSSSAGCDDTCGSGARRSRVSDRSSRHRGRRGNRTSGSLVRRGGLCRRQWGRRRRRAPTSLRRGRQQSTATAIWVVSGP
jgi:hypothetical protein